MKQLAMARAVIVVWTPTSVKSDFVRAEAGRAKADGKLIPVKDGVSYGDIPLPFGEMHTEDLAKRELVRAAVVAQLAKPAVEPSLWWTATRGLRHQALTWMGIGGAAITLFSNLGAFLDLANWARWIVTYWSEWVVSFWGGLFAWLGIKLGPHSMMFLTMSATLLMMAIGSTKLRTISSERPNEPLFVYFALNTLGFLVFTYIVAIGAAVPFLRREVEQFEFPFAENDWYILVPLFISFWIAGRSDGWHGILGRIILGMERMCIRVWFVLAAVLILVILSELSKYSPNVREWLKAPT